MGEKRLKDWQEREEENMNEESGSPRKELLCIKNEACEKQPEQTMVFN